MPRSNADDARLGQIIATLDGSGSRKDLGQAAVRLDDLAAVMQMQQKLRSAKAAGATPTAAEFDALVSDVQMIGLALIQVARALQARQKP